MDRTALELVGGRPSPLVVSIKRDGADDLVSRRLGAGRLAVNNVPAAAAAATKSRREVSRSGLRGSRGRARY